MGEILDLYARPERTAFGIPHSSFLGAKLVVLSACDTARGWITDDGVIKLSRAFISAGVPSVLVSFCAIADAPTFFLMMEFYQNLPGKSRQSHCAVNCRANNPENMPKPIDWEALTLIGEVQ